MGNDRDHADDKMPSTGSTKDLSTGRNLHCKRQPRLAKCQSPLMAGSTHHARYKGDQYQTTAFISSLRHEFPSFSEKNPCCFRHSTAAVPSGNEFSAGYDFADHHLGNAPAS